MAFDETVADFQEYEESRRQLNNDLTTHKVSARYNEVLNVYLEVRRLKLDSDRPVHVQRLTKILKTIKALLPPKSNIHADDYQEDLRALNKYSNELRRYPMAKCLVIALVSLTAATLLAISGIFAAASLGVIAPVVAFGIVFGVSKCAAQVSLISGAIGAGVLMFSGPVAKNTVKSLPLKKTIDHLISIA